MKKELLAGLATGLFLTGTVITSSAAPIYWTDWTNGAGSSNGFQATGVMTTPTSTIDVSYTNPQGVAFIQTGTGSDYFQSTQDVATSPYTSDEVDNNPTASEMIGLRYAGSQTLTFSETVANPVFSYVSLNGNGYSFDQDFDILSFGHTSDGNSPGYWGAGTSYKNVVDLGGGVYEYQLLGTGEPHGTIQFTGTFDTVSWNSLSSEYWNGFTVGVQGTAEEVYDPVPEPATMFLFGTGLAGLVGMSRRKKKNQ